MLQRLRSVNQGNPDFGLRKPLDWCKVSCSRGRTLKVIRVEIAGVLNMSQPAISCSSRRGEKIAIENRFKLIDDGNAQKHKRYPFHCQSKSLPQLLHRFILRVLKSEGIFPVNKENTKTSLQFGHLIFVIERI